MNQTINIKPPGSSTKKTSQAINPFARALAETEKGSVVDKKSQIKDTNPFGEALAQTGGQFPPENLALEDLLKQRADQEKQQRYEVQRQKLHDQINPIDQEELFNANKIRTQKELEEIRKELKKLAHETSQLYKEVDIATMQTVTQQGLEGGIGLKTFFENLKQWIVLLTQKVRSARTWLRQTQTYNNKKRKIRGGVNLDGGGVRESKAVFDMMHHERSSAYSGA